MKSPADKHEAWREGYSAATRDFDLRARALDLAIRAGGYTPETLLDLARRVEDYLKEAAK
jgi:hypothetical protein